MSFPLIFEKGSAGRRCAGLAPSGVPGPKAAALLPASALRPAPPALPEVHELDLVRHYVALSRRNMGIDTNFYPLGSCTMKYNPKVNEKAAALPGFARIHPYQPEASLQGALELLARLEGFLAEASGMDAVSLQPAAGAHGEYTAMLVIRAFLKDRGDPRDTVLIPDSAHGTNPSSCARSGLRTVELKSDAGGEVDLEDLRRKLGPKVAALMITNPNTLGLFDRRIVEVARLLHAAGALLYMDGANFNAILGRTRPGDFGVDLLHFNLHKTFSTPHGGGGPGAGPIGVKKFLEPYLPVPRIAPRPGGFSLDYDRPRSIGKVKAFFGNFGILVRAYAYIRAHGAEGLRRISGHAVLNANYLRARLGRFLPVAYPRGCMHECVLTAAPLAREHGVHATDVAKRLLDFGIHPPTMYFPLIVEEALMIEPTETESKETLDHFVAAMEAIAREARENPDLLRRAPLSTPVGRLDQVRAVRELRVRWTPSGAGGKVPVEALPASCGPACGPS